MVLMPFQVIRSRVFTYNPFQVILITLGLTFQNLAVDKTNNCKIPLSKVPVRVWVMTSSLTRSNDLQSSKSFRVKVWEWDRKDSFPVLKVCLTSIDPISPLNVNFMDLIPPQIFIIFHFSWSIFILDPYFILFRCIF